MCHYRWTRYHQHMTRTNREGRDLRRVLEYALNRDISDVEMAGALGMPTSTFGKRKRKSDFPTFEELTQLAVYFGLDALALQVDFGFIPEDALREPRPLLSTTRRTATTKLVKLRPRPDAAPL